MSLPQTVRVKISSENVESIGLTPVVSQDMKTEDLVTYMLAVTGKDAARVKEILGRGSLVSGASRFRWTGFDVLESELRLWLTRFPDADPSIPFDPEGCTLMTIHVGRKQLPIERAAGEKRRLFHRRSFWGEVLAIVSMPEYTGYSYRDRADQYRWHPAAADQPRLHEAAKLLTFSSYEAQIRGGVVTAIDLYVPRATYGLGP